MLQSFRRAVTPALLLITVLSHATAQATDAPADVARGVATDEVRHQAFTTLTQAPTRSVDLVLALDVSGSMLGLIDSAKQRLWEVVNEFNQAQRLRAHRPTPDARSGRCESGAVRI
jgi:hypothetical protein